MRGFEVAGSRTRWLGKSLWQVRVLRVPGIKLRHLFERGKHGVLVDSRGGSFSDQENEQELLFAGIAKKHQARRRVVEAFMPRGGPIMGFFSVLGPRQSKPINRITGSLHCPFQRFDKTVENRGKWELPGSGKVAMRKSIW